METATTVVLEEGNLLVPEVPTIEEPLPYGPCEIGAVPVRRRQICAHLSAPVRRLSFQSTFGARRSDYVSAARPRSGRLLPNAFRQHVSHAGGTVLPSGNNIFIQDGGIYGNYPGDGQYPEGEYLFLDFSQSKISSSVSSITLRSLAGSVDTGNTKVPNFNLGSDIWPG